MLYRLATEQNDAGAQYQLGNCYRKGQGVPRSNAQALKWYRLAAHQGHNKAKQRLGRQGVRLIAGIKIAANNGYHETGITKRPAMTSEKIKLALRLLARQAIEFTIHVQLG